MTNLTKSKQNWFSGHQKNFLLLILLLALPLSSIWATNYYVNPVLGDDQNSGSSILTPFQSLEKVSSIELTAGDAVLLAAGHTFSGSLRLINKQGTVENPIVLDSYSWGNALADKRAIIDAKGFLNGILLENCSHIIVKNLIISANGGGLTLEEEKDGKMRCGVLISSTQAGEYTNIRLHNLLVQDVFFEDPGFKRGKGEVRTPNGSQSYGWGIRFLNTIEGAVLKDLGIYNCEVKNVAHTGIKFTGRNQSIHNIEVYNNRVIQTGGPGIQMSGVNEGHVKGNFVNHSGSNDDSRKWGRGSGLWTWGTSNVVIENNHFLNANGPADSAGCHIDFNCYNIVVQYNFSANNAGGFCEILGNNHNCAYRYNISVNDGHRVKGENGAFQEGKTFWLSGFVGKKKQRHGPYNSYFYNNTIYVSQDIVSKIAVTKTARGILVANNIFYIEGESQAVLGDQYNPEKAGGGDVEPFIFENNLFLKSSSWPEAVLIQPHDVREADPQFFQKGGLNITDYLPLNTNLIKDQGMEIKALSQDSIGLSIGLNVQYDILGNEIKGKPDLGAIEVD